MSFRLPTVVSGITQSMTQLGHAVTGKGGDGRFFRTTRKGEIQEWKEELHSANKEKKKDAVKKVIAAMTVGKDVSALFPDVVNCMQTANIELKKLVYLYVINYAKLQPELAILAINTFRKDSLDANPLIRALAVRTMGCIRLEQVVEYLVEPLKKACHDKDPYVRKTAATCICKLYETSPETVEDHGFIEVLREMLSDGNPTVVSNAVASLSEISSVSGKDYLAFDEQLTSKLLMALSECSEWGQIFILNALAFSYEPASAREATSVLERVSARLSHANAAVLLATVGLMLKMLDRVSDAELVRATHKKLGPPLITLLAAENEVQYVALRNISLIVQKYPGILASEVKMFFCKYNDPYYVKLEKLEILVRLTNEKNIEQVLMELKEYATEVEVEFVRRTIRAIGRCAIKLEKAAERCVAVLLSLIETRVNYVVQETIVVMKDIFRKYPNRYEKVISILCSNLDSLDEPDAKASILWIIGEYAERIDNAEELLSSFLDGFLDESLIVQQQLLTAAVKFFVKCPKKAQPLVTRTLKIATEENDDPDLRDRAFIYWRLLSTDPTRTKQIVLAPKPPINDTSFSLEPAVLDRLLIEISSVASVFHRLPESFVTRLRGKTAITESSTSPSSDSEPGKLSPAKVQKAMMQDPIPSSAEEEEERDSADAGSESSESSSVAGKPHRGAKAKQSSSPSSASGPSSESSSEQGSSEVTGGGDLLAMSSGEEDAAERRPSPKKQALPPASSLVVLLTPETRSVEGSFGLEIKGVVFKRQKAAVFVYLSVVNRSSTLIQRSNGLWAVQINKNSFGFAPRNGPVLKDPVDDLPPDGRTDLLVELEPNCNLSNTPPSFPMTLQVAVKTPLGVFYLRPLALPLNAVLLDKGPVDKGTFKTHWTRMGDSKQMAVMGLFNGPTTTGDVIKTLRNNQIDLVLKREQETFDTLYCSAITTNNLLLLFDIALQKRGLGIKLTLRSDAPQTFPILVDFLTNLLGLQLKT